MQHYTSPYFYVTSWKGRGGKVWWFTDWSVMLLVRQWWANFTLPPTATSIRTEVFSPQEAAFFKEANALDYELYDFAQTLARQLTAQALQRLATPTWDFCQGNPQLKCFISMSGMIYYTILSTYIFVLYLDTYSIHLYVCICICIRICTGMFIYLENSVPSISTKWSSHQLQLCGLKKETAGPDFQV